jgi:hypothetical protein
MLERVKFVNHINEEMLWGKNGIYVNYNDLHDFSWNYTSDNNKISSFNKGIVTKTIPIVILCNTDAEGLATKNKLLEIGEKDILAVQHGKLIIGDYYLKCFIRGSKKSKYLMRKGYMECSLSIVTDYPQWVKESITSFRADGRVTTEGQTTSVSSGGTNLDFNRDFPYDYTSDMTNKSLNNTGFVGTNFKLIIYGAAVNPTIHIGGHTYQVNCSVGEGEYLTINSLEKKIYLTKADGTTVNCFNNRNRVSYIFERIPPGQNTVTWDNTFGFDVVLLEERSEPRWT